MAIVNRHHLTKEDMVTHEGCVFHIDALGSNGVITWYTAWCFIPSDGTILDINYGSNVTPEHTATVDILPEYKAVLTQTVYDMALRRFVVSEWVKPENHIAGMFYPNMNDAHAHAEKISSDLSAFEALSCLQSYSRHKSGILKGFPKP